jgi:hypothetical protein
MSEQQVKVNGHVFGYSSIKLSIASSDGVDRSFERVVRIEFRHSLTLGVLRSNVDPRPLGESDGQYEASATLGMYLGDFVAFRRMLAEAPGVGGYLQKRFDVALRFAEEQDITIDVLLSGCRITSAGQSFQKSSGGLIVDVGLYVREIQEDGLRPVVYEAEA